MGAEVLGTLVGRWYVTLFGVAFAVLAVRHLGWRRTGIYTVVAVVVGGIAENGAVVPIDITSNIAGTRSISVFIEKNPFPYTGTFDFPEGTVPYVHLRAKLGKSTPVRVVVAAGGKFYTTAKEVKVTIGGCGG